MLATLIIALVTFVLMAASIVFFPMVSIGKVKIGTYWIVAVIGAVILLSMSLSPIHEVYQELTAPTSINPLKILILFFSMTILSIYLDEVGLFRFLAGVATKKAKGNQLGLFFAIYGLTSILTIFTSNDIVILTLTPFICFFAKNAKINPLPYLITEFAAANTWSMMLIIGNPTNIYLASSAGIDFLGYFKVMLIPTLFAGLAELLVVFLVFRKQLKAPMCAEGEEYRIESKPDLILGLALLTVCLVLMAISSYVPFEMWMISAGCAVALIVGALVERLLTHRHWEYLIDSFKRLPYSLIPFVLSMFVMILALTANGVTERIGTALGSTGTVWKYGALSFLSANVINNITMSVLFSSILTYLPAGELLRGVYATVVGSNLGAFLTPIGALAGIMWMGLLKKQDVKMSYLDFIKYGSAVAVPSLAAALGVLCLVL